jgi:glycosyltransferase involved in cell wall biosynthesis
MAKIMIFNSFYYPNIIGGAEKSVQMIAEGLASQGHDITVVCTSDADHEDVLNGVKIYYVRIPNLYWGYYSGRQKIYKKLFWHIIDSCNFFARRKVSDIMKKEKPQIIHTNNLSGFSPYVYAIAKREKVPVVHTIRDYYFLCSKSTMFKAERNCDAQCLECKLLSFPKRMLSKHVDSVVGVSNFILQKHLAHGMFSKAVVKKRIFNIFNPNKKFVKQFDRFDHIKFGFLGILAPTKGVEFVIERFIKAGVSSSSFEIYGKGHTADYEDYLKKKYSSDSVVFHGFKDAEDIYPNLDVLVIPSLWHEPFPRTLIEAFSYGIPVIASNRGGIPEMIVHGENGFLFNPEDDGLIDLIRAVANGKHDLKMVQANAFHTAESFRKEVILSQYLEMYGSFL